jgi:hypothetical protein
MGDAQRVYYDHEEIYRRIRETGERGRHPAADAACRSTNLAHFREYLNLEFKTDPRRALDLGCGTKAGMFVSEPAHTGQPAEAKKIDEQLATKNNQWGKSAKRRLTRMDGQQ